MSTASIRNYSTWESDLRQFEQQWLEQRSLDENAQPDVVA
jgi:hypothetical protein